MTEHLRFTKDAKKTLENGLREALRRGDRYVGTEHLVLGFLNAQTGAAGDLLRARGLTLDGVRVELDEPGRAAG